MFICFPVRLVWLFLVFWFVLPKFSNVWQALLIFKEAVVRGQELEDLVYLTFCHTYHSLKAHALNSGQV